MQRHALQQRRDGGVDAPAVERSGRAPAEHAAVRAVRVERVGVEPRARAVVLVREQQRHLGHHRLPSNKFLLYDHSLRIPMLFSGPGVAPGTKSDFLGTQVYKPQNPYHYPRLSYM